MRAIKLCKTNAIAARLPGMRRVVIGFARLVAVIALIPLRLDAYPDPFPSGVESDLIVIAHVKEGSIKKVKVPSHTEGEGPYEVTHMTLVVTTALKGELSSKELEIAVGSGLCLVDDGKGVVKFGDNNPDGATDWKSEDLAKDQIWFLNHPKPNDDLQFDAKGYCIMWPGETRPLSAQKQVEALLQGKH